MTGLQCIARLIVPVVWSTSGSDTMPSGDAYFETSNTANAAAIEMKIEASASTRPAQFEPDLFGEHKTLTLPGQILNSC